MQLRTVSAVVRAVACLAFGTLPLAGHAAEAYPGRPVRIVVPFSAGGGGDFIARAVATKLRDSMSVPVIVDNRDGGSGVVGTQIVAKATPNGYTILTVNPNFAVNPAMMDVPYRTPEDFTPIASFINYSMALGARSGLNVSSIKDVIDAARQSPGKFNFAAGGGTADLAIGLLEMHAKVQFTTIPYKGAGPATVDVAAGNVDFIFTGLSQVRPHVQTGRIKLLGTTGLARAPSAPEIRTLDEQGVKGFEALVWWGFVAPAGTPREIVATLNREIARAAADPVVIKQLDVLGGTLRVGTPEEFGAFVRAEIKKWGEIVRRTRMKER